MKAISRVGQRTNEETRRRIVRRGLVKRNSSKPALWLVAVVMCLLVSSCAGGRVRTAEEWGYPLQKVYSAGEADVWMAVIQTLPQMGFIIQFMDKDLGLIRANDDIRRDAYSFFTGISYWMEVRIREVAPGTTMIFIEYPQVRAILHEGVTWDPEADIFQYIESHMDPK